MPKKKYIGTFGSNHGYAGCFTEIVANTKEEAQEEMQRRYQGYWSMVYETREEAGVEEHNLIQIEPGVCPPFAEFGIYALQSWLIERGIPFDHDDMADRLVELATEYWREN